MPLARISLRRGQSPAYHRALMDQVYLALRETYNVPEDDRFMVLSEHDEAHFVYGRSYLGVPRSDGLVIIQLTVSNTRDQNQKKALYRRLVDRLVEHPGLRPEDVFINLIEVLPENWSMGLGLAPYAQTPND